MKGKVKYLKKLSTLNVYDIGRLLRETLYLLRAGDLMSSSDAKFKWGMNASAAGYTGRKIINPGSSPGYKTRSPEGGYPASGEVLRMDFP